MEVSVVIPAYKEAENLKKLLPELERALLQCCQDNFEIIVVDCNPSLDHTESVVTQFPHSKYLIRQGGNAYGDAIRTGFSHAEKEFVAVMDGDGSHRPVDLVNMLKFAGDYDIVIGSRYISGGKTENPAIFAKSAAVLPTTLGFRAPPGWNSNPASRLACSSSIR